MHKNHSLLSAEDLNPYCESDYLRPKSIGLLASLYPGKIDKSDQYRYISKADNKTKIKEVTFNDLFEDTHNEPSYILDCYN